MIAQSQKQKLKKAIGQHYSKKAVEWLGKEKILNAKGEPYSPDFIRGVMNGYPNEILEAELFKLADWCRKQKESHATKREEILKKIDKVA